jgi:hypothetical protein
LIWLPALFAVLALNPQSATVLLPTGPSIGNGPYDVAEWPNDGCKGCAQSAEDVAAYEAARNQLVSGNFTANAGKGVDAVIVRFKSNTYSSAASSLREIRSEIAKCTLGSQGTLKRDTKSGAGMSFGIRWDCPDQSTGFMSISVRDSHLKSVYYMPDRPFLVNN